LLLQGFLLLLLLPSSYQPSLLLLCPPLVQQPFPMLLTSIDQALPGQLLLAAAALTFSPSGAWGQAAVGCFLLCLQALLR
jgi:hypothetical protein